MEFFGGYFWRNFSKEFFGGIIREKFLGGFFGRIFLEGIFGRIFWEDFFGRNSLGGNLTLLKSANLLEYGWNVFVCQDFGFCQDFGLMEKEGRK